MLLQYILTHPHICTLYCIRDNWSSFYSKDTLTCRIEELKTTKLLIIKRPALLLRRHFTLYDFSSSHLNWWSMKHQLPGAVTSRRFISQSKYNNTNVLWMIMKVYLRRECYCTDWLQLIKKHLKMLVCSTAGLFSLTSSHQNTLLCHTQRLIYTHVGIVHIVDCNLSSKTSARCVVFTEKKSLKKNAHMQTRK